MSVNASPAGDRGKQVHFRTLHITDKVIDDFADLIGDHSSIHRAGRYAETSPYGRRIVHGMLPVLAGLVVAPFAGRVPQSIKQLTARFLRPIFPEDRVEIRYQARGAEVGENFEAWDYEICQCDTEAISTTGLMGFTPAILGQPAFSMLPTSGESNSPCIVGNGVPERAVFFNDIELGQQNILHLCIHPGHIRQFQNIMQAVAEKGRKAEKRAKSGGLELSTLLAAGVLSTMVGMRMPGKYATFMSFQIDFSAPMFPGRDYRVVSKVVQKSESTSTVVQSVQIVDLSYNREIGATGKIHARAEGKGIVMPSLKTIEEAGLGLDLAGKVAVITGSSRGIGATIAKMLALQKVKVVINYCRNGRAARRVVEEIRAGGGSAMPIGADVSDRNSVKRMIRRVLRSYGRIDILVNNAARDFHGIPFAELSWEDIDQDLAIILKGAFNCCQEVIPGMLRNHDGRIINLLSVATDFPPPNQAKYVIAKTALLGLTRALAMEYAKEGLRVNAVVPNLVLTDMTKHITNIELSQIQYDNPIQRLATPLDVARTVVFLASSMSAFTTGQRIMVTGGQPPFL